MDNFNRQEATVLNYIQSGIPLCPRPFAAIAADTGLQASQVKQIIAVLKNKGPIFGGLTVTVEAHHVQF